MFDLRFSEHRLAQLADEYSYSTVENNQLAKDAGAFMQKNGYLTKPLFLGICRWKTPRSQPLCESNDENFIQEATQTSTDATSERLRIKVLTLLRGVSWPTASVLLHFGSEERYPILDFRALWSLGFDSTPRYDFDFWWKYVQVCRTLAGRNDLTMRRLDQALWQYSKANQQ